MTGKREDRVQPGTTPTVVLRSDIYREAVVQGIDISDACNRATCSTLRELNTTGSRGEVPAPPPVIIAKNGASPQKHGEKNQVPSKNGTRSSMRMTRQLWRLWCRQKLGR